MSSFIVRINLLTLSILAFNDYTHADALKNPPAYTFDKAGYEKRIKQAFDNEVMGYSTVLMKNGQVVSTVSGGLARNQADGKAAMTSQIPANVGSSIKFTGGVTLLHLFSSQDTKINPNKRTVTQWLDQPIFVYFPKIWQDNMHASIKKITFRHVLQHRSGFRSLTSKDLGADGDKRFFDYLAKGVDPANFDQREYANANFSLLTYLIPFIADPSLLAKVNQDVTKNKWSAEGKEIHQRIADVWENHMHTQIYTKITPKVYPSCNPKSELLAKKQIWAPDYTSAIDTEKGTTRDSREANGYCQAQGGWYISAHDLAAFTANFSNTNFLVSESTRTMMFDDEKPNERLVWSFRIGDAEIDKKFHYSSLPYMGGDHGGAHASILMLPDGYYAVGVINSNDFNSGGVTRRLLRGFKTAIGVPEDAKCPSLVSALKSTKANVALAKAELKTAQQDLADAVNDGIKGGYYVQAVKKARADLNVALDKLESIEGDIEAKVCIVN